MLERSTGGSRISNLINTTLKLSHVTMRVRVDWVEIWVISGLAKSGIGTVGLSKLYQLKFTITGRTPLTPSRASRNVLKPPVDVEFGLVA
jgi:hypothetical protein